MNKKKKLRFLNGLSSSLTTLSSIGGIVAVWILTTFLKKSYKHGSTSVLLDKLYRGLEDLMRLMVFDKWYKVILFILVPTILIKIYNKNRDVFKNILPKKRRGSFFGMLCAYLFWIILMVNFGSLFRHLPKAYEILKINQRFQEVCSIELAQDYTVFDQRCYVGSKKNVCDKSSHVWAMDHMNVVLPNKQLDTVVLEAGAALLTDADFIYAKSGSSIDKYGYNTKAVFFEDDVELGYTPKVDHIRCGEIKVNYSKPNHISIPTRRMVDISPPPDLKDAVVFSRSQGDNFEKINGIPFRPCIDHFKWQLEGVMDLDPFVNSRLVLYDSEENQLDVRKVGFEDGNMKLHNNYRYEKNGKAINKQSVGIFRNFCFSNAYAPGKYFLEVILDVDNVIKETNEDNNSYIFPFEIEEE